MQGFEEGVKEQRGIVCCVILYVCVSLVSVFVGSE